jgi:hypothetical protein
MIRVGWGVGAGWWDGGGAGGRVRIMAIESEP